MKPAAPTIYRPMPTVPAILLGAALLAGCVNAERYERQFAEIGVGNSRTRVVSLMGEPTYANGVELPLVAVEQLAWRSPPRGRTYVVLLAQDRVVLKARFD